jgi:hypothetical protein
MAVFACMKCAFTYEFVVTQNYAKSLLLRTDHCAKCETLRTFRYLSHSGSNSRIANQRHMMENPAVATMWWRKQQNGRTASAPLDAVCKINEW